MSSAPPQIYTVIGVYEDAKYDDGRFAESFFAKSPGQAETLAQQWAREQGLDEPGIIIAAVLEGEAKVVA